jgi:hypothetical protein
MWLFELLNLNIAIKKYNLALIMISQLTYQNHNANEVLAAFRYAMLSKIIFAQYS